MDYIVIHHGIKGQKWGVRRFENQDGSLTPKGKETYSKSKTSKKEKIKNIAKGTARMALGILLITAPDIVNAYFKGQTYLKAQNLAVDAYAEARGGLKTINAGFTLGAKQVRDGKAVVDRLLKGEY